MSRLKNLVEHRHFTTTIIILILINAATLGLETDDTLMARYGGFLHALDHAILAIFVLELTLRLIVYRIGFFRSG